MKKLVPRLLIITSQILIGALFLVFTLNNKSKTSLVIDSKEIEKLSEFVYEEEKIEIVENEILEEKIIEEETKEDIAEVEEQQEEFIQEEDKYFMNKEIINTYTGILTGYGPDCQGCGNFNTNKVITSSGYHIADIVDGVIQPAFTINYTDNEYGEVRIVAADSSLPYKSIVRITIPNQEPIIAIVLDRGSTVGFENCRSSSGCLTMFDLLFETESNAIGKTFNVTFDILRIGE